MKRWKSLRGRLPGLTLFQWCCLRPGHRLPAAWAPWLCPPMALPPCQRGDSDSRSAVSDSATPWAVARQAPPPMGFSRQECWSGVPCPPQGSFPSQGSNPGLLHCRQILYRLNYQGRHRGGYRGVPWGAKVPPRLMWEGRRVLRVGEGRLEPFWVLLNNNKIKNWA